MPIASIRTDGGAQHRISPDPDIVNEYAELMRAGVEFPPVSVRYDGTHYWPSDGFQRLAAATLSGFSELRAVIRPGTRADALWDSYAANATHGLRRTPAETARVIEGALRHPNALRMSNVQIAKHLHISEPTVRRWRERLTSSHDEDGLREVTRGGVTYCVNVRNIGKSGGERRPTSRHTLGRELKMMKEESSQVTRGLWAIIGKWLRGLCDASECTYAVEQFLWSHRSEFAKPASRAKSTQSSAETVLESEQNGT